MNIQPNNPLHSKKLVDMLNELVEDIGWENLGHHININCFRSNPSIKSSLTFLRKTPWAREKFEQLYLAHYSKHQSMPQQTDPWKKVIEKKK